MQRQTMEYHPALGYRFIPGLRTRVPFESGGYLVRTNSQGFRDERDFERAKPPGTFRILAFGDSNTAGDGVSNRYRFTNLLERSLAHTQVYNFGLPASGTDQQYLVYREFGRGIECDAIIVHGWIENIRRVASRFKEWIDARTESFAIFAKPYFELEDGRLVLHHKPVPKGPFDLDALPEGSFDHVDRGDRAGIVGQFDHNVVRPSRLGDVRIEEADVLPEYREPDGRPWRLMRAILEQWAADCAPTPLLFMPLPLYQHLEGRWSTDAYRKRFREIESDVANFRFVDVTPRFRLLPPEDLRACRFDNDPHFTRKGHRILSEAVKPALEAVRQEAVA